MEWTLFIVLAPCASPGHLSREGLIADGLTWFHYATMVDGVFDNLNHCVFIRITRILGFFFSLSFKRLSTEKCRLQRHANGTSLEVAVSFHPKHCVIPNDTAWAQEKRGWTWPKCARLSFFCLLLLSLFLHKKVTALTMERKQNCYGSVTWEIILMWSSSKWRGLQLFFSFSSKVSH